MSARILDGTATARAIREELRGEVEALARRGVRPGLGVVLVGDDPASAVYVGSKTRACEQLGILSETRRMAATATTDEVAAVVEEYNRRRDIHAVLVQLPLPPQVDATRVLDLVDPAKDVDGFHPDNVGRLVQKRARFVPCTPAGIMELLARHEIPVAGRRAVVIGRSDIVGKPMALLLMHADATVTVCHSRTRDLAGGVPRGGHPRGRDGTRRLRARRAREARRRGDRRRDEPGRGPARRRGTCSSRSASRNSRRGVTRSWATCTPRRCARWRRRSRPVPGGVGPLTIALLLKNTVRAAAAAVPTDGGVLAAGGPDRWHRVRQVPRPAAARRPRPPHPRPRRRRAGRDRPGQPRPPRDRGRLRRRGPGPRRLAGPRRARGGGVRGRRGPRAAERHRPPPGARRGGPPGRGRSPAGERRCW